MRTPAFFPLLVMLVALGCDCNPRTPTRGRDAAHLRGATQSEMLTIYMSIENLANKDSSILNAVSNIVNERDTNFTKAIAGHLLGSSSDVLRARYDQTGRFVDSWGNDFHFSVEVRGRKQNEDHSEYVLEINLRSNGPNGHDEGGKGDDLVFGPRTLSFPP
jgi:hypothetical protein